VGFSQFIFVVRIHYLFVSDPQVSHGYGGVGMIEYLADFLNRHSVGEPILSRCLKFGAASKDQAGPGFSFGNSAIEIKERMPRIGQAQHLA
jgi:hypothetical protein